MEIVQKGKKNNCCTHPIPLRVSKFVILLSREQFPQNTFQLEQIIIVLPKSIYNTSLFREFWECFRQFMDKDFSMNAILHWAR